MKIAGPLLALLIAIPAVAFGRLGETEAECATRYGQPIESKPGSADGEKAATFKKDGVQLTISFLNGRAVSILYRQLPGKAGGLEAIRTLLDANAQGSTWAALTQTPGSDRTYLDSKRADGKARAAGSVSASGASLAIISAEADATQKQARAGLKGF